MGVSDLDFKEAEQAARLNARRSIVANCDISEKTIITEDMLIFKRPGIGISPKDIDCVVGKKASRFIPEDTILELGDLA